MKKLLTFAIVALFIMTFSIGCGQQKSPEQSAPPKQQSEQPGEGQQITYEDGIYYAENPEFDEHGWKAMATIVVKNGKIENVFYDEINEEGAIKSFDVEYTANMKAKSGITPLDAYMKLEKSLIEKQYAENVDAVSGATQSSKSFKELASKALNGTHTTAKGEYADGLYKAAEEDFDSHGWKALAAIVIKDGKIQTVAFDEINKDDSRFKSTDEQYAKNMQAQSGTTPAIAIDSLSKSLAEKQDISQVDSVTGATGTSTKFKTLMEQALSIARQ